jgi:hypothetical protein
MSKRMKPRWYFRTLLLVALLLSLLSGTASWAQEQEMTIEIQPGSGPPGTEVRITGSGAPPGSTVRVLAASWSGQFGCPGLGRGADLVVEVPADENGEFTATHQTERLTDDQVGFVYIANVVLGPSPDDPRAMRELSSNRPCFEFSEATPPTMFPQTGFRIDHPPFVEYFRARGGVDTFGFPVSRPLTFLGCMTQFFQRHLLQQCGDGPVQPMNLLDPDLMAVNRIDGATFPEHNPAVAQAAPSLDRPDYVRAVEEHIQTLVPNTHEGLPVGFFDQFMAAAPRAGGDPRRVAIEALELWGFPTSQPAFDPNNRDFVYQRFQRGIMHYDHNTGATEAILLADWFKSVITGQDLPPDLAAQVQGSRFLRQYCPDTPRWLCRPDALPGSDLTQAFESMAAPAVNTNTDIPPEAQRAVDAALQDAANHLGVPRARLRVVRVEERQWPDASLGCPQPGQMYAQVITPGYLLVIVDETQPDRRMEYHTGTQDHVVRC